MLFIVVLVLVVVVFVEAVSTNKSESSHDMRIRKGNSQKMKSSLISVSLLCMKVLLMSSSYSGVDKILVTPMREDIFDFWVE